MAQVASEAGTGKRLDRLDRDVLASVVRKVLDRFDVKVTDWHHQIIKGDWSTGSRLVARLYGRAIADGQNTNWSVYLKVPNPLESYRSPWHREDFHREVRLYQSGILESLPGGITAPLCLQVDDHDDDQPWMWLEEVGGLRGREWPLPLFEACALQFGRLQGAFLANSPLSDHPWLDTTAWFRPRMANAAEPAAPVMEGFPTHPITANLAGTRFGDRLKRLWAERNTFFDVMRQLPLSLSHGDFNINNLYAPRGLQNTDRTMVIDWQYAGVRQIGGDIAGLIADSSILPVRCLPAEPDELMDTVLEAYCKGLKESDWKGDPELGRFACLAHLAIPWTFNALHGLRDVVSQQPTEETRNNMIRRLDTSLWRLRYLLDVWDRAFGMLDKVRRLLGSQV
jgi:hypothetical protein